MVIVLLQGIRRREGQVPFGELKEVNQTSGAELSSAEILQYFLARNPQVELRVSSRGLSVGQEAVIVAVNAVEDVLKERDFGKVNASENSVRLSRTAPPSAGPVSALAPCRGRRRRAVAASRGRQASCPWRRASGRRGRRKKTSPVLVYLCLAPLCPVNNRTRQAGESRNTWRVKEGRKCTRL